MVYIVMTDRRYDQEETIECPHCKKSIDLGLDFEYDFDEDGASASATIIVRTEQ